MDEMRPTPDHMRACFVTHPYTARTGTDPVPASAELTQPDPAPNATQPMVPTSPTITVKVTS